MQDWLWLLWLLLPVAAFSGWLTARKGLKTSESVDKKFSPDYYKGLNYLLNEQQDKAIEVFMRMVEVDNDTVETHLALGGLFRKRGEVDRAIRIHQNLIARPTLSNFQRSLALLELGKDYMRAGLLDRAEGLFKDLIAQKQSLAEAYKGLIGIYQQEHDWQKCINYANKLQNESDEQVGNLIAHFYCELANEQRQKKTDKKNVVGLLQKALAADSHCVRANMIRADMDYEAGHYKKALRSYLNIFEQDENFAVEVSKPILACLQKGAPAAEFHTKMRELIVAPNGHAFLPILIRYIQDVDGDASAKAYIEKQLASKPSLSGLVEWLEIERAHYFESELHDRLLTILNQIVRDAYSYQCVSCGFPSRSLYWQCPSCQSWGSIKPDINTFR